MDHNTSRPVFKRYGRSLQLLIESAQDLTHVLELDEALWLSTSVPLSSLRADSPLLHYLDIDADGRIKAQELKQSIRWTLCMLSNTQRLNERSTTLSLAAINTSDSDGKNVAAAYHKVCQEQHVDSSELPLETVRRQIKALKMQSISGGGVVLPDAVPDPDMRQFLNDAMQVTESARHPSGQTGIQLATLKRFLGSMEAYQQWLDQAHAEPAANALPFNDETAACYRIIEKLRAPLDHFFACCRTLSYSPSLKNKMWPPELPAADAGNEAQVHEQLMSSPIAEPVPEGSIRLTPALNPCYHDALAALLSRVAVHALEQPLDELTSVEWAGIKAAFAPFAAWQQSKQGTEAEKLGIEKIQTFHAKGLALKAEELIAEATASALALNEVQALEKLALFQGHLLDICNNIVSCPDLYCADQRALFEEGTLIMDGRRFNLAVMVPDRKEHIAISNQNSMFVLYAHIEHKPTGQSLDIAVPVTSGTQGNLAIGKRGIFQHTNGTEWTARVIDIVDRPVSLREAAAAPFIRLGAVLTGKIEAITASAEKDLDKTGAATLGPLPGHAPASPPPAGGGSSLARNGGLIAGGGIALAALGSSFAFITKTLADLHWWQVISGLLAAILAVLIPSLIMAALRLRKRDLSCILEGSGWAINSRMRLTRSQRMTFTSSPGRPDNSLIEQHPFKWMVWAGLIILIALALTIPTCRQTGKTVTEAPVTPIKEAPADEL